MGLNGCYFPLKNWLDFTQSARQSIGQTTAQSPNLWIKMGTICNRVLPNVLPKVVPKL